MAAGHGGATAFDLRTAGYSLEARRNALCVQCSVEFKGYAYRALADGSEPHVMAAGACGSESTARRLFGGPLQQETGFKKLPDGFEVRARICAFLFLFASVATHCS